MANTNINIRMDADLKRQKSLDLCGFPGAVEKGPVFTLGGLKTASKA